MADLYVNLKYGNLTQEQRQLALSKSLYDSVIDKPKWLNGKYPEADSVEMLNELHDIRDVMQKGSEADLKYSRQIDENLWAFYCNQLQAKNKEGLANQIRRIMAAIAPAIMRLKNSNQRPRPYQVAMYLDVDLHPHQTVSGNSPSWPSGHSCQARMLTLCLSEMYPELQEKLWSIENMVHNSRLIMGIHYPSDLQAGADLADEMFDNEQLTTKLLQGIAGLI
jgi:acid phosphatase (class A)